MIHQKAPMKKIDSNFLSYNIFLYFTSNLTDFLSNEKTGSCKVGGKNFLPFCDQNRKLQSGRKEFPSTLWAMYSKSKANSNMYINFHDSRASGCVFNVLSGMPLLAIGCGGNILLAAALGPEKILKVLG